MPLTLRPARAEDHAAWLPLWQAYQAFYNVSLSEAVTASTWARILDEHEPIHATLAWQGATAVGLVHYIYHRSCWSIENSCYLQDLIVSEGQRGQGTGRRLIEHVYQQAKADGCVKVHWLTHETNSTAIGLYEQVAERPGFIQFRKAI
ncbi:GNAT family N-acetyltransferase [Pseudomonas sp. NPDC007930]|uniref:GNAT family N-acetyltransferase n=1 Tax=Pseudomonas sp. NPDC007930 TaxID=3364417 RepID=UPI0036E1231F